MSPDASLFDDILAPAGGTLHDGPDWAGVRASVDSDGIALTPPLLTEAECEEVRGWFGGQERFRSTVVMQRYGFGRGTYRYLADPLPGLVRELREQLYRPLSRIANDWSDMLRERRDVSTGLTGSGPAMPAAGGVLTRRSCILEIPLRTRYVPTTAS